MYQKLGQVILKSGEAVEAGVVIGPDLEWAPVVEKLLQHKGEIGNWQNSAFVRQEVGIETYFYILHRNRQAFSNILTSELNGVGILGHVWTLPSDRRQNACTRLMELQMEHFKSRGGQALFLKTDFDSAPFYIYEKFGFTAVEPQSGHMEFYTRNRSAFENEYFAVDETEIQVLNWPHWPGSAALFLSDSPGIVRCAPAKLFGRYLTEGPLLPFIKQNNERQASLNENQFLALQTRTTGAVVGLSAWNWHPLWKEVCVVDVYCHPSYWSHAPRLLAALKLPAAATYVAYGDAQCPEKLSVLEQAGFRQSAFLKKHVALNAAKTRFGEVWCWEK
jgi:hypothetical protein